MEGSRIVVYLDRFASNEPIAAVDVEIESEDRSAVAKAVEPGVFIADADWLAKPGKRHVVFSIVGEVDDLLYGTLEVPQPTAEPSRRVNHLELLARWNAARLWGVGSLVAAVVLSTAYLLVRRRRRGLAAILWLVSSASLTTPSQPTRANGGEDHSQHERPLAAAGPLSSTRPAQPARSADGSVFVPKSAQRTLGIRTVLAEAVEVPATVELQGRVLADPNAGGRVQSTQAGRIEPGPQGLPGLGQKVSKGDVLAYVAPALNSVDRSAIGAQLAEVSSQLTLARQQLARLDQLEGSVPQKEIDAARSTLRGLEQRREALSAGLTRRETLVAPTFGVVSATFVVAGQVVDAREVLFEIMDPQRLLIEALAYDTTLATDIAAQASATTARQEGLTLSLIGAGLKLRELAIPLQFRVHAPAPALAIGEPVVVIAQRKVKTRGVVVPRTALVGAGSGESTVWVHEAAERFVPSRVQTQPLDAANVLAVQGLDARVRLVTQGAGLLGQIR